MKNFIVCAAALACSQALSLAVVTLPVEAFNNGTINPSGPRPQAAGKNFFNIEGTNNGTVGSPGSFSSYGVMDFTLASESIPGGEILSSVNLISISLTQANSSFTANGGLAFYLTTDTTTSIDPGTSPLLFDMSEAPEGLGSQLSSTFFLGNGTFTQVANGRVDTYTFGLDPNAASHLSGILQNGGNLRLIVAPTDAAVAATYAGFSNSTASGPLVSIDYSTAPVPEPTALALGSLGLALVLSQARRRRAIVA